MKSSQIDQILSRFDKLEDKVDKMRAEDMPLLREHVATLVEKQKATSRLHAFIGSVAAIIIGAVLPHR